MRTILLLVAACLVASAGCLNKATPTPDTNSTNSTTPGGGTMMAKELVNETHSFLPPNGAGQKAFKVEVGYSKLNITVTFRPGSPAPMTPVGVSQGITVKVGTVSCTLPDGPIVPTMNPAPCNKMLDVQPGDMKVEYSGQGDVNARVLILAS